MLDERGYEIPDNTPVSIPTRLRLPQSRTEQIRAFIRSELAMKQLNEGHETFAEADDFDLPGEDWVSPYEETFEPPAPPESGMNSPQGDPPAGGAKSTTPPATPPAEPETA